MRYYSSMLLSLALVWIASIPAQASSFDTLKPQHPRVLATQARFDQLAERVKTDPLAKQWYARLKERAPSLIDQPLPEYELRDGRRLLYVSREVKQRVLALALLDRIQPNQAYRDRIWADLEAAAAFPDWHPDHFLDVAEMAFAFAIAYDWCYDRWTPEQRKTIREAIFRHGIEPTLKGYEQGAFWTRTSSNWNQVCNGSMIVAALAVYEHDPQRCAGLIKKCKEAIQISMRRYAPDGGYEEGPGYWSYGTTYNVLAIAALRSALGHDFGLSELPGFAATGGFPIQMTGPTGRAFNFGYSRDKPTRSPAFFGLSQLFDQPFYARYAAAHNRGTVLDLLWYDPALVQDAPATQQLPLGKAFESAGVAVMRSAWDDPDAWFVGAKGGWMGFGHAQMDLGSFILERRGVRWLIDLGADNYNLPGYFHSGEGDARWRYYRNRAEGHNTLLVNPDAAGGQNFHADAPVAYDRDHSAITIGLDEAYNASVTRRIVLDAERDRVTVTDAFAFDKPSELWWFAHTRARVTLENNGRIARMQQDGKTMRVTIVSPKDARFKVMPAKPLESSPDPAGQNPNDGSELINTARGSSHTRRGDTPRFGEPDPDEAVRKLAIHLSAASEGRIEVRFEPVSP